MRAAESTARWECEENNRRCKWVYDDVVLATPENCQDKLAGINHKALAMEARAHAQSIKEEKADYEALVIDLTSQLSLAKVTAK